MTRNVKYARREVLRLGGLGAATAAVVAACGEHARGQVGRVGTAATTTSLPEAVVTNVTGDHLGLKDVNTIEQLAAVKRVVKGRTSVEIAVLDDAGRRAELGRMLGGSGAPEEQALVGRLLGDPVKARRAKT